MSVRFNFIARDKSSFEVTDSPFRRSSETDLKRANQELQRQYGVRIRRPYVYEYNCHGLTFVGKLGWFADVRRLLNAHSYRQTASLINSDVDDFAVDEDIEEGDVIVYHDDSPARVLHTGLVWALTKRGSKMFLTILSKWGQSGEYFHRHDKVVPEYGKSVEIWTDRGI